jgi:hypothetical protein
VAILVLDWRTAYDPAAGVVVEVQDANQALRTPASSVALSDEFSGGSEHSDRERVARQGALRSAVRADDYATG